MDTYIALESHASVDAEEQDDVAAGVECFCKQRLVLFLCGPEAIFHRLCDVIMIP